MAVSYATRLRKNQSLLTITKGKIDDGGGYQGDDDGDELVT